MENKEMKIDEVPSENNAIQTPQDSIKSPAKRSRSVVESSVDIYTAQCGNCRKWRILKTQEEFEEVRSKIIDEPFFCTAKPGISCEDPADIDYDATRTWVIDKPNLPKSPNGFKRCLVLRKDYTKMDVYYITPLGKKLRTRNEVAAYIKAHPEHADEVPESFSFAVPKIMENTIPPYILMHRKRNSGVSLTGKKSKKSSLSPSMKPLSDIPDKPE